MGSSTRSLKIGIIGFGPFAQFLAKTMIKQGHLITATSRSDYSGHPGVHFYRDMEEFMKLEHDVILICTSIMSVPKVVKSIPFHCLKKPTLFADVLSVKEHPKQILLQEIPEDSDLVCTHPMFGPESGKDGWKDLTLMYERVRVKDEALCSSFLSIFEFEGCKMLEMTCEEHDRLAAESQFVAHTIGRYASSHTPHSVSNVEENRSGNAGGSDKSGDRSHSKRYFAEIQTYPEFTPFISKQVKIATSKEKYGAKGHEFELLNMFLANLYRILSEMHITNTPIDTKGFEKLVQLKESTVNDSFDLYSGLFIHNRFAKQQLKNLESALQRVKESLEARMSKEEGHK